MKYIRLLGASTLGIILFWAVTGITIWEPIPEGDPRGMVIAAYTVGTLFVWIIAELTMWLDP